MSQFFAAFAAGVVITGVAVLAFSADDPSEKQSQAPVEKSSTGDPTSTHVDAVKSTSAPTAQARPINAQADASMDEQTVLDELQAATIQRTRKRAMERLAFLGTDTSVPVLAELAERGRPADRPAAIAALGGIGTTVAVDMLIGLSDSGPAYQRRTAVAALGRAGGTAATQWLKELADSTSVNLASAALTALADAAGDEAQAFLLTRLRAGNRRMAVASAQALGQLGTPEALDALITVISDQTTANVRHAAIRGLVGFEEPRARKLLAQMAQGDKPRDASAAVDALGQIADASAVKILGKVALSGATSSRSSATYALGRIGDAMARDALIKVLAANDNHTSWGSARGLADIFDDESIEALLKAIQGPKQAAQAALSALSSAPRDERIVSVLKRLLQGGLDNQLMAQIAPVLGSMLGDEAIPLIEGLFKTAPMNHQYSLISALTQIGTAAAQKALRRAVDNAPPSIQLQALQALVNGGGLPKDEIRDLILSRMKKGMGYQAYSYADMLARLGDEASNVALVGMLETVGPSHVGGVASAIANQGSPSAMSALLEFARTTTSGKRRSSLLATMSSSQKPEVREFLLEVAQGDGKEADEVMRNMAWNQPELLKSTALTGLDSDRPARRAASVAVLGRLNDDASLQHVVDAAADKDPKVRQAALSALQNNQNAKGIDALMKVYPTLEDKDKGSLVYGLARTGRPEAITMIKETLEGGGTGKHSAMHALLSVSNPEVMTYLKGLADAGGDLGEFVAKQLKSQLGDEFQGGFTTRSP